MGYYSVADNTGLSSFV